MQLDMADGGEIFVELEKFLQLGEELGVAGFEVGFLQKLDGNADHLERKGAAGGLRLFLENFGECGGRVPGFYFPKLPKWHFWEIGLKSLPLLVYGFYFPILPKMHFLGIKVV